MKKMIIGIVCLLAVTGLWAQNDGTNPKGEDTVGSGTVYNVPFFTGSRANRDVVFSENFDAGIPATWTVDDNAGNGFVWEDMGTYSMGNYTGCSGDAASVNSDDAGSVYIDTDMISPPVALGADSSLNFDMNFQDYAGRDHFDIDISIDGGASWTNLVSYNEDHGTNGSTPGEAVSLDISAYDGETANFRFHYDNGGANWDWYAQFDCLSVEAGGAVAADVPTMGEYGLFAFIGLIALMGLWMMRRRA